MTVYLGTLERDIYHLQLQLNKIQTTLQAIELKLTTPTPPTLNKAKVTSLETSEEVLAYLGATPPSTKLPADLSEHFAELAWRAYNGSDGEKLNWPIDAPFPDWWHRVGSAIVAEIERLELK